MKIDYELVRNMMVYLEDLTDGEHLHESVSIETAFPNVPADKISYHYKYLVDSGMIQTTSNMRSWFVDITPLGHEFLASTRKSSVWNEIKGHVKPLGQVPLDIIIELGKYYIKRQLDLDTSGE